MPPQGKFSAADIDKPVGQFTADDIDAGAFAPLSKATSIGPVPVSAKIGEYLPLVGGGIGGYVAGPFGAAAGGAIGTRAEQYLNALTGYRRLPEQGEALKDMGVSALEQGTMELGARGVGKLVSGPLKPTMKADIALAKTNKELGLRLSPSDILADTAVGKFGQKVEGLSERSVTGGLLSDLNRQITRKASVDAVQSGHAALRQVGEALHNVVTSGPSYDMLPHRVEAARIFTTDVVPKILDLYARKLPSPLVTRLQSAIHGGLSPDLAQKLIPAIRKLIQHGQTAPVPTGTLDALEAILQVADTTSFDSATKLRTSLIEIGRRGDAVMAERGKALTSKFAGDLTSGLSTAYPAWDPLRTLYAEGAEASRLENVKALRTAETKAVGQRTYNEAVRAKTGTIPKGTEANVIQNLRTLDEALRRVRAKGTTYGNRIYNAFELAAVGGAVYKYGPEAAMAPLAMMEVIPSIIVWAAHNPTMTKILTEGLVSQNPKMALSLLGRVTQAYFIAQGQQQAEAQGPPVADEASGAVQ